MISSGDFNALETSFSHFQKFVILGQLMFIFFSTPGEHSEAEEIGPGQTFEKMAAFKIAESSWILQLVRQGCSLQ